MENKNFNFLEKKKQLASTPGSFVIISNTLESKYYLSRIIEYDRLIGWIKKRIGVNIDTEKALDLIRRCQEHEKQFGQLLTELRSFVRIYVEPPKKSKTEKIGDNDSDSGDAKNEIAVTGDNGNNTENNYNPVAEAVATIRTGKASIAKSYQNT
ncbi:MAG: hypothetical protein ACK415_12240 [Thermodesulfovibrionales bacterium]